MLRPSRKIKEKLEELLTTTDDYDTLYAYGECRDAIDLKEGDEVTGFEIIAMLPIEQQRNQKHEIWVHLKTLNYAMTAVFQPDIVVLNRLYTYKDGKFEVKE